MINQARVQGWIATDETKDSLTSKLADLRTALESGEWNAARTYASDFLSEVGLTSCGVYNCGGSQPLTSEAYALMRFNMEYLRERIPTTIRTTVIESDEDMDSFIVDEIFRGEGVIGDQDATALRELSLVQDFAGPEQAAQFGWPNGAIVPFVFSFDGRAATFDLGGGGRTLRTEALVLPLSVLPEDLVVRTSAGAAESSITVSNLVLDGVPIPESVVAENSGEAALGILRIEASGLGDGFSLAGTIKMQWTAAEPSGSSLSVQLRAVDSTGPPQ